MKVAFFNTKPYDRLYFDRANERHGHELVYHEAQLAIGTVHLVRDETVVCCFINDHVSAEVLEELSQRGVRLIALRSAGFNHVDMPAARRVGMPVVRVPAYSPYAVAEHTVGLLLALNRRLPKAYNRVREGDFSINGLMGYDVHGTTAGVIGTGKIGTAFLRIMKGFGCSLLAVDVEKNPECIALGVSYTALADMLIQADIISLHCPLIQDDVFARLMTFPNVMITSHQAFFTVDAVSSIAATTLANISAFENGDNLINIVN